MGFLPVGHTHEDIDQLFSCVSRYLQRHSVLTIPGYRHDAFIQVQCICMFVLISDLEVAIHQSFSPEPDVIVLDSVVDAKGWMQELVPALHDHLKAHHFKFERNEVGECRMFYKEWSTDAFWLPETGLALLPTTGIYTYASCITHCITIFFLFRKFIS